MPAVAGVARGYPIGASSPLLAGESKGDSVPVGSGFQRRRRCLGGRNPKEGSALLGRKNPMKRLVSWHTTFSEKSSVLYLLRPLTLERGCFLVIHTISSGSRTGGFCAPPGTESGICSKQNPSVRVQGMGNFSERSGEIFFIPGDANGTVKSVGAICEQGIVPKKWSGFLKIANLYETTKQIHC